MTAYPPTIPIPPSRPLLRRLFGRVAILSGGTSLAHVAALVASPLLTRLYSPSDFAVLGFHQAIVAMVGAAMTCQFEAAIPIPKSSREARRLLILATRVGAMLAIVLTALTAFAGALPFDWFWNLPVLVLLLLPLFAFGESYARSVRLEFVREGRFREMSIARILQAITSVIGQVVFGIFGFVSIGLAVGDGISRWMSAAFMMFCSFLKPGQGSSDADQIETLSLTEMTAIAKEYARFPLFVTPSLLLALLVTQCPAIVLPILYDTEFAGQFALANRAVLMPLLVISQAMTFVFVSDASRMIREENPKLPQLILGNCRKMVLLGGVICGVAAVASPLLFPIVFGTQWRVAGNLVPILSIAAFAQSVGGPVFQTLVLLQRDWQQFSTQAGAAVAVVLALWLGSVAGFSGAWTTLFYSLSVGVIQLVIVWQSLRAAQYQSDAWSARSVSQLSVAA